jgi:hypothetical protein
MSLCANVICSSPFTVEQLEEIKIAYLTRFSIKSFIVDTILLKKMSFKLAN